VGAFSGFLVGTYRCTDISKAAPKFGAGAHISICMFIGAFAGALSFLVLAGSVYGLNPFSKYPPPHHPPQKPPKGYFPQARRRPMLAAYVRSRVPATW